jgi:hypothetical protein
MGPSYAHTFVIFILHTYGQQVIGYTLCFGLMGVLAVQSCEDIPSVEICVMDSHTLQLSTLLDLRMIKKA